MESLLGGGDSYNMETTGITTDDLDRLCRICASPNDYLIPIFEGEGVDHELAMKIEKYLPVKISEGDSLPLSVCYQCASTLIAWHDLFENSIKADKKLRELEDRKIFADKLSDIYEEPPSVDSDDDDDDEALDQPEPSTSSVVDNSTSDKVAIDSMISEKSKEVCTRNESPEKTQNPTTGDEGFQSRSKEYTEIRSKASDMFASGNTLFSATSENEIHMYDLCDLKTPDNMLVGDVDDLLVTYGLLSDDSTSERGDSASRSSDKIVPIIENVNDCLDHETEKKEAVVQANSLFRSMSLKCKICGKCFQNPAVFKLHSRIHTGFKPFICKSCGKKFRLASSLKYHLKSCKSQEISQETNFISSGSSLNPVNTSFICKLCGIKFSVLSNLNDHLRKHKNNVVHKFKCYVCREVFTKKLDLNTHLKTHCEVALETCHVCDKTFTSKKDLENHKIIHSSARPFKCSMCGINFKRKSNLLNHMKSHLKKGKNKRLHCNVQSLEDETFVCDCCEKEFRSMKLLEYHRISHTGERKHQCTLCGMRTTQAGTLARHMKTVHLGIKDYPCRICKNRFTTRTARDNHLLIHSGEKHYVCDTCFKAFRTQAQLKLHESVHSDKRPFVCNHCQKSFRRKYHLTVHTRVHTGERPYLCNICEYAFTQSNDLTRHKKHFHVVTHSS